MKSYFSDIITRWRHTLGYGVHSPLAFRIIKECVHPDSRYAYYADSAIDYMFAGDRRLRSRLRMLVRLIANLKPRHIHMPDCDRRIADIIAAAFPAIKLTRHEKGAKNADFIVIFGDMDSASLWNSSDEGNELTLLEFHQGCVKPEDLSGAGSMKCGPTLIIACCDFTLRLRRHGMQRVEYKLL